MFPGLESRGADLMSRFSPLPDKWRLHTIVVERSWAWLGKVRVDLFTMHHKAHCPLWFSLSPQYNSRLWVNVFAGAPLTRKLLLSMALFSGMCVKDICMELSWTAPSYPSEGLCSQGLGDTGLLTVVDGCVGVNCTAPHPLSLGIVYDHMSPCSLDD